MVTTDFVGSFERLVKLFTRNRTDFLIVLVLVVALAAGYAAYENRQFLVSQWQKDNHYITPEQFHQLVKIDQQVEESLRQLMNDMDADRVVLRRFHNGKQDFTGIPFENVTDANEVVADRFLTSPGSKGDLPMASVNGVLLDIWSDPRHPECRIYLSGEEPRRPFPDSGLRAWALQSGIAWSIVCPVINMQRYPIGLIAVSSTVPRNDATLDSFKGTVNGVSQRVSGYLEAKLEIGHEPATLTH